jgi:hypothetical protein
MELLPTKGVVNKVSVDHFHRLLTNFVCIGDEVSNAVVLNISIPAVITACSPVKLNRYSEGYKKVGMELRTVF